MVQIEHFGDNRINERQIYVLELPSLAGLPRILNLSSQYFTLLLACDARQISHDEIAKAATSLVEQGVVYVCSWGPDCQRVEDIFDEVIVGKNPDETVKSVIITTQHNDESLDEALWFLLNVAFAAEEYEKDCGAELIIVVANSEWTSQVRARLLNQDALSRDVVGEDTDE